MAAKVTIGVDATQLNAGMAAASNTVQRFATDSKSSVDKLGASIKGAFAFAGGIAAVHQLGFAVKGLLSDFDDINDSAIKLGVSAESFQHIKLAAELSGGSVDGLTTALLKMEAGLQRGGAEGEKLANALGSLGISVASFTAAKPEEKLQLLAAGFQKARAEGKGLSEIQDLFKKQFTELIPLLSTSSEEMAKLSKHKVMSNEDVARLAQANDELDLMINKLKIIAATAISRFFSQKDELAKPGGIDATAANPFQKAAEATTKKRQEAEERIKKGGLPTAAAAAITPTQTTNSGTIPGLEAATGFPAASGIPGLRAAAPQRASAERTAAGEKAAVGQGKFAKEQLDALNRNNEILEKLIAQ